MSFIFIGDVSEHLHNDVEVCSWIRDNGAGLPLDYHCGDCSHTLQVHESDGKCLNCRFGLHKNVEKMFLAPFHANIHRLREKMFGTSRSKKRRLDSRISQASQDLELAEFQFKKYFQ